MYEKLNNLDIRIKKTYLSLFDALLSLLEEESFGNITVNAICARAFISRTAFYAHFQDKYDLLSYYLGEILKLIVCDASDFHRLEVDINSFVRSNKKIITNILKEADAETLALVRRFMRSAVQSGINSGAMDMQNPNHIIFTNFISGGLINLLTWIVDNRFPLDVEMMSPYLYGLLDAMIKWDEQQNFDP